MRRRSLCNGLMATSAGAWALGAAGPSGLTPGANASQTLVRMTMGLRATSQSIPWIGAEAGLFMKHGLSVQFPALEVGGIESAQGLVRGDWEFSQTGSLPIVEEVLKGKDAVILLRNSLPHAGIVIMARREFTSLHQLSGRKIGVLTDAVSGQTGVQTRLAIEAAGAAATYVGLGTYEKIYSALAAKEIEAGALPVDFRFLGESQHGWNAFDAARLEGVPSVFATTRRRISENRELVLGAVRGVVETIHYFKTQREMVVPLLQRFLNFNDRKAVEAVHAFYAPLFAAVPRPDLAGGMARLRDLFVDRYPAARALREPDIVDQSIIDEVEQSGFIKRLSASGSARSP